MVNFYGFELRKDKYEKMESIELNSVKANELYLIDFLEFLLGLLHKDVR